MDNTIHFRKHNAGLPAGNFWQESPFYIQLREEKRLRSQQRTRDKKRNLARRALQQKVLQILIDADYNPVHLTIIAEQIGRSRRSTVRFLSTHADDLWIGLNGGRKLWMTSLRIFPDRLFY